MQQANVDMESELSGATQENNVFDQNNRNLHQTDMPQLKHLSAHKRSNKRKFHHSKELSALLTCASDSVYTEPHGIRSSRLVKQTTKTIVQPITVVDTNKQKRTACRMRDLSSQQQLLVRAIYDACVRGDLHAVNAILDGTYDVDIEQLPQQHTTLTHSPSLTPDDNSMMYIEPTPLHDQPLHDIVESTLAELERHPTPIKLNTNHNPIQLSQLSKFDINFFGFQELLQTEDADTTLLHLAAQYGHIELVEYLISRGIHINSKDGNGSSALDDAAGSDNMHIARLLRVNGCVLTTGKFGVTPLHTACAEGAINMMKYLIEVEHTDINHGDKDGYAPIFWALDCTDHSKRLLIIEYLIQHGANVNQLDRCGRTPLMWALRTWQHNEAEQRQPDVVALLLKYDADPYIIDNEGLTVFDLLENTDQDSPFNAIDQLQSIKQQQSHPLYKYVRKHIADANILVLNPDELPSPSGLTDSARQSLFYKLTVLKATRQHIQDKHNVRCCDPFSINIDIGQFNDTYPIITLDSCSSSADTNKSPTNAINQRVEHNKMHKKSNKRSSKQVALPVIATARYGTLHIRQLSGAAIPADCTLDQRERLIEREYKRLACRWMILQNLLYRAVKHEPHGYDERALLLLAWMQQYQTVCILNHQPIFSLQFTNQHYLESPIHISLSYVNDELNMFNYLLAAGLDYNTTNTHGYKPIHTAAMWAPVEAVNQLISLNVDVNQPHIPPGIKGEPDYTPTGWTPLILAVDHPESGIVAQSLLSAGANINQADHQGNTPFIWAVFKGKIDMVQLLLSNELLNREQVNQHGCTALHYAVYRSGKSPDQMKTLQLLIDHGVVPTRPYNLKNQRPMDLLNSIHDVDGLRTYNILRRWYQEQYSNDSKSGNDSICDVVSNDIVVTEGDLESKSLCAEIVDVMSGEDESAVVKPVKSRRKGKFKSTFAKKYRLNDAKEHYVLEACKKEIAKFGIFQCDDIIDDTIIEQMDDISRGLENRPIPVINTINNTLPQSEYTNEYILHADPDELVTSFCVSSLKYACQCAPDTDHQCACIHRGATINSANNDDSKSSTTSAARNKRNACSSSKRGKSSSTNDNTISSPSAKPSIQKDAMGARVEVVYECTDVCGCSRSACTNRPVQSGIGVSMCVYLTRMKGWAARATQDIRAGTWICEYIGALLGEKQALQRQDQEIERMSYLFKLPQCSYTLDPQFRGNVARFFNHSCQPNLIKKQVYIGTQSGHTFPRVAFFAARDIVAGEELCMDYGYEESDVPGACMVCYCGKKNMCRHTLI